MSASDEDTSVYRTIPRSAVLVNGLKNNHNEIKSDQIDSSYNYSPKSDQIDSLVDCSTSNPYGLIIRFY
ncbi:hypothetical protein F0562_006945 [Nyssa sinensis]|uniref:Uncharacterized protein n=1 Tax=Nyssa sinensis TaxID=561372 RepID=A0A5J5A700_9ASTE|nr:hypothetical protein F0562_006945 [Nyssa sinensis]